MAEETTPEPKGETAEAAPHKPAPRRRSKAAAKPEPAPAETPKAPAKAEGPRVPRRADLPESQRTLMRARDQIDRRRPLFGRQARYRYYRIGRDMSWRAPRGLQSKQRRHYGYRPKVVRIGYRSPARVRGLVPSGFRPIIVHTTRDLEALNAKLEAAIIARTVGTRRRLVLEETARKLGIRVLNPIVKSEREA
ncbi:MAG TPA: 50S ribosomal protein L32e [Thermoplasmata archaeon]|nr:50S ribosomal protein L32e [Thermoplasmata archaeon]